MSAVTRWFSEISTDTANDVLTFQFPTRDIDPVGGVDRHSGVFVSVTELSGPLRGLADFPTIGAASLSVHNVAASDDGTVQIWLGIAPPDSVHLNVRLQFLISND
jgi:hypothetical protein